MDENELRRLFELFDQALTSSDERVVNALRSLLMITALTDTNNEDGDVGPYKQLLDRIEQLEHAVRKIASAGASYNYDYSSAGYYPSVGDINMSSTSWPTAITIDDEELDRLLKGLK